MGKFDDIDLSNKKTMEHMIKRHQEIQAEKPDRARELVIALLNPWVSTTIQRVCINLLRKWEEEDKQKDDDNGLTS